MGADDMDDEKLVEWFLAAVTDWDGSQMADGEPPRDVIRCKDLRKATDRLLSLREENARYRTALEPFVRCTYQGDSTGVTIQTSMLKDEDWIRARAAITPGPAQRSER